MSVSQSQQKSDSNEQGQQGNSTKARRGQKKGLEIISKTGTKTERKEGRKEGRKKERKKERKKRKIRKKRGEQTAVFSPSSFLLSWMNFFLVPTFFVN